MIKIITGNLRGRIIPIPKNAKYRPSTGKWREAAFSALESIKIVEGAEVLDLFCGSGSLGFEALSRSARAVTFADLDQDHIDAIATFGKTLGISASMKLLKINAVNLPKAHKSYDLILMDPPYDQNMVSKTLFSIINGGWLKNQGIIAVDLSKREEPKLPVNLSIIKERLYNNNKLLILRYEQD